MSDRQITHKMPEGVQSVACLGDSITQGYFDEDGLGWVARLGQLLNKEKPLSYNTRSFGISGDTVFDAWHNLTSQVTHNNPDILIIKIGVNDVCIREGIEPESFQISRADRLNKWLKILNS
jgi:lysophospholipase L1-like esterase